MRTRYTPRFQSQAHARLLRQLKPIWFRQGAWIMWMPLLLLTSQNARAHEPARTVTTRLQGIVDELRSKLAIPDEVTVSIVPTNPLMASVEAADGRDGFVLSMEADFVERLTQEELEAVIAHELGHVWIFTHHPYLQTERLANQIAMRLVTRESLEQVYGKVWKDAGKGDLSRFLGEARATKTAGKTPTPPPAQTAPAPMAPALIAPAQTAAAPAQAITGSPR
jgi:hypothetical protein